MKMTSTFESRARRNFGARIFPNAFNHNSSADWVESCGKPQNITLIHRYTGVISLHRRNFTGVICAELVASTVEFG